MTHERMNARIQGLLDARVSVGAKLAAIPTTLEEIERCMALAEGQPGFMDTLEGSARSGNCRLRERNLKRKLAEFEQSLANFQKYGQETPPTGNKASVEIDVPAGTFKITEHVPEG